MQIVKTVMLVGCLAVSVAAAAGDKEEAVIRAITEGWMKAYNAGDVEAIVGLYADDAVVMPPGAAVAKGPAAIRQFLLKDTAAAKANGVTLVIGSTHDVGITGNFAWDSGNYTVRDKSGATVDSGSYLAVWRKVGDHWKYLRDIWNSDRPSEPASK